VTRFVRLTGVEWTKIRRRNLNWIALAVVCVLIVAVYLLLWAASGVVDPNERVLMGEGMELGEFRTLLFLEDSVPFGLTMLYEFGVLAGIVVVGANVGSEYSWNTIRTNVAAHPNRVELLLAKLTALGGALVLGMLIALAVALLTSAVITLIDGNFTLSFVDLPFLRDSLYSFGRLLLEAGPYFALAAMGAILGKSATSGISIAVGVLFLEGIVSSLMTLAGGWVANVPDFLLNRNADGLAREAGGSFRAQLDQMVQATSFGKIFEFPDPVQSGVVLAVWAAIFMAGSIVIFRRQDLGYQ